MTLCGTVRRNLAPARGDTPYQQEEHMGTRTIRFDDLEPQKEADVTVTFSLDRREHEIDLTAANAEKMRLALAPFIEAARKAGRTATTNVVSITRNHTTDRRQPARMDREQGDAIRVWARKHGFKVSDRGRISSAVLDAWANQDPKTGEPASNETAPRVDDTPAPAAPAPAEPTGDDGFTYAQSAEAYRTMLHVWAQANGYKIGSRGLGVSPPVNKKFQREMKLLPPQVEKTG